MKRHKTAKRTSTNLSHAQLAGATGGITIVPADETPVLVEESGYWLYGKRTGVKDAHD